MLRKALEKFPFSLSFSSHLFDCLWSTVFVTHLRLPGSLRGLLGFRVWKAFYGSKVRLCCYLIFVWSHRWFTWPLAQRHHNLNWTLQDKMPRKITAKQGNEGGILWTGLWAVWEVPLCSMSKIFCIFKSRAVISLLLCGTALWIMEL